MNLETESVLVNDCNTVANNIIKEINDIDAMEKMLSAELTSADLFKIDSAILASLRNTVDFSRDLLYELENGKLETVAVKPPKNLDTEIFNIQMQALADITLPLQKMFDEMADNVIAALG